MDDATLCISAPIDWFIIWCCWWTTTNRETVQRKQKNVSNTAAKFTGNLLFCIVSSQFIGMFNELYLFWFHTLSFMFSCPMMGQLVFKLGYKRLFLWTLYVPSWSRNTMTMAWHTLQNTFLYMVFPKEYALQWQKAKCLREEGCSNWSSFNIVGSVRDHWYAELTSLPPTENFDCVR